MVAIVVPDELLASHIVPQDGLVLMPVLIIFANCASVLLVTLLVI